MPGSIKITVPWALDGWGKLDAVNRQFVIDLLAGASVEMDEQQVTERVNGIETKLNDTEAKLNEMLERLNRLEARLAAPPAPPSAE